MIACRARFHDYQHVSHTFHGVGYVMHEGRALGPVALVGAAAPSYLPT